MDIWNPETTNIENWNSIVLDIDFVSCLDSVTSKVPFGTNLRVYYPSDPEIGIQSGSYKDPEADKSF